MIRVSCREGKLPFSANEDAKICISIVGNMETSIKHYDDVKANREAAYIRVIVTSKEKLTEFVKFILLRYNKYLLLFEEDRAN